MNEKFKGVKDADLATQAAAKREEYKAMVGADTFGSDDEQVTAAIALKGEIEEIEAEISERAEAAAKREETLADLKGFAAEDEESEDEGEEDAEEEEESEEDESADEGEAEGADAGEGEGTEQAAEKGKAEFATKPLRQTARKTKRPERPANKNESGPRIVVSANVDGFTAGTTLGDLGAVTDAIISKMKGFAPPSGDGQSVNLQKFSVASIQTHFDKDLTVDRGSDDYAVVERAADESRLESGAGKGSLTAAGGWCAPSETLYDLMADETTEGILSIPEMKISRGGVRYTEGPQFAEFYANAGFIQTEAQAIAGTTKPCYEVECPSFDEERLDAVGLCIKVPILTNAAWPELVKRFTSGTLVAHQHMVNADVIGRMVALAGTARVFDGMALGSTASDTLEILELVADQRRQSQRLSLSKSMEVVVPFWVKGAVRNDLSRRTGQQTPVSDQQINAHFAARNLKVSFVYDWQSLPTVDDAGTAGVDERNTYPATFQALVYPAGTFVKGTSGVINLSAVYDAASLAVNTYTGLFAEEGLLVIKRQYGADLVTIPVCNAGRTGAADLTCA